MKKIIAAAIATALLASAAAPTFAATQGTNCVFKDKALCTMEPLSAHYGD